MFNPAVTLALWLVGGLPTLRAGMVVVAQLLGGIAAAGVVGGLFPGEMNVNTSLGGGTSAVQGCFIEMFLTAELVFVILMVAAEKHKATFMAPVAIGGAFFLTQLIGMFSSFSSAPCYDLLGVVWRGAAGVPRLDYCAGANNDNRSPFHGRLAQPCA